MTLPVTGADLISVQQNFGKTAAAAIPEPMASTVVGLSLVMLLRRRTRS